MNIVTKRPSRSRGAGNWRSCSMILPDKIFRWPPADSFLKHVVFSRKDRGGGDIQGLCSVLITVVAIMYYILRSEPNNA